MPDRQPLEWRSVGLPPHWWVVLDGFAKGRSASWLIRESLRRMFGRKFDVAESVSGTHTKGER